MIRLGIGSTFVLAALALAPGAARAQGSPAGAFTDFGIVAKDDAKPSKDSFTVRGRVDSATDLVTDGVANGATVSVLETSSAGSAFLGYDEIDSLTFDASDCSSANAGLSLYCKDPSSGSYLRLRGTRSRPGTWRLVAAVRGREFDPGAPFAPPLAAELSVGIADWLTVTASCKTSQNATRMTCSGEGELCPVVVSNGKGGTYTSNCNGTVTDSTTGLVWEKKTGTPDPGAFAVCGGPSNSLNGPGGSPRATGTQNDKPADSCNDPHDVNNSYSWTADNAAPWLFDGNAATLFLAALNTAPCFANHCDWRLPTVEEFSGRSDEGTATGGIVDTAAGSPAIDPIFGPTTFMGYWTSSTAPSSAEGAFITDFYAGDVYSGYKLSPAFVRAVRTGP